MAKAKTFARKERIVTHKETPGYVELNLTPEEAELIKFLLGNFVTGPKEGPRGLSSAIYKELDDCGVKDIFPEFTFGDNYICFKGNK